MPTFLVGALAWGKKLLLGESGTAILVVIAVSVVIPAGLIWLNVHETRIEARATAVCEAEAEAARLRASLAAMEQRAARVEKAEAAAHKARLEAEDEAKLAGARAKLLADELDAHKSLKGDTLCLPAGVARRLNQ